MELNESQQADYTIRKGVPGDLETITKFNSEMALVGIEKAVLNAFACASETLRC